MDTNVLAYAEGVNDADKQSAALELIRRLPQDLVVVPVQVLGELFNVLVFKARRDLPRNHDGWHRLGDRP